MKLMDSCTNSSESENSIMNQSDEELADTSTANREATTHRSSRTTAERGKTRGRSRAETEREYFQIVNERLVNDITVEFFYKPHTLCLLLLGSLVVIYLAFTNDDSSTDLNAWLAIKVTGLFFLVISVLAFPNGPFIRPHPALWRCVFGMSVLYLMLLLFTLFQNFRDIKTVLKWLDPDRLSQEQLVEKEYAVNCSNVTIARLWSHMDVYAAGHFLGWAMKAMLIRHGVICWYISIAWEITELAFSHLLPNFQECWWDAILLDVLLCNGLGIWMGLYICRKLEMRNFRWESIRNMETTRGKFKRAVLQFTPESWTHVNWFGHFTSAVRRTLAIYAFVMVWIVTELNTFFLKHIFAVDTDHPLVTARIVLIGFISAPTIRQYYSYATDPRIKRMGMQCWVYTAVTILEAAICAKFGKHQLPAVQILLILIWILFLAIGTIGCVYVSVLWANKSDETEVVKVDGNTHHHYLDSSCENLAALCPDFDTYNNNTFVLASGQRLKRE